MRNFLSVIVFLVVVAVNGDSDFCFGPHDDYSCAADECCITSYWNTGYKCKDKGDDVGDSCGGSYNCGCVDGLVCLRHSPSLFRKFKLGYGTCQRPRYSKTVAASKRD